MSFIESSMQRDLLAWPSGYGGPLLLTCYKESKLSGTQTQKRLMWWFDTYGNGSMGKKSSQGFTAIGGGTVAGNQWGSRYE